MRRHKNRAKKYKSGFSGAFSWVFLLSVIAVSEAVSAAWPGTKWPYTSVWPWWSDALFAVVAAALAALLYVRQRRSQRWKLHRELVLLAEARLRGTWLNRDAHQAFKVQHKFPRQCRLYVINRIAEDDARDIAQGHEHGEQPLSLESFAIFPLELNVIRHDNVVLVDAEAGTGRALSGGASPRALWRLHKTSRRTGLGFVMADPAEIAELVTQLQGSEPVGDPEEDG